MHRQRRIDDRARSRLRRWRKRGQEGQALGRSRGGFTTKIHAKADASGTIIGFDLTGGEASDTRHFETLLDIGPDMKPRAVVCDKGYASKANREAARKRGIAPVIPHKANEKERPSSSPRPSTKLALASNKASAGSSDSKGSPYDAKRRNETSDRSSVSPLAFA
ncbi:transposase [Methylosinus sporium]|uniref:Transposase n=1 Tax=Methylosinus sporium TaxID=428 RepID=A0A549SCP1_METSR|nr:transposase [Methylosinus sp. KRF6]TRL22645.1 transposase [Methylosinus sporium]